MNPKYLQLFINIAAAVVGLFVIGYVAYSWLRTEAEAPCGTRYPAATRFSLQTREGKPLSAIELQARAGLRDFGVVDNAAVVHVEGGPAPEALEVRLRKLPPGADADAIARNGIEFHWAPPGMAHAAATCLSYSVWLPDKFAFGTGGFLPGVFGKGAKLEPDAADRALSVFPRWDESGKPMLTAVLEGGEIRRISGKVAALPTERWFKIEQEVVLNEPGKADGRIRLWVNGVLALEDLHVPLRRSDDAVLSGVLASIGYQRAPDLSTGMLRVSPFEIAWR